jgi:hypothetical protein
VHTGWHGPRLATTRYRHLDLVTSDTVELPQRRGRHVGGDGAGAGGKDRGQDPLLPRRCDSRMAHDPSADRRQDTVAHQGSPPLATHSEGVELGVCEKAERRSGPPGDGRVEAADHAPAT